MDSNLTMTQKSTDDVAGNSLAPQVSAIEKDGVNSDSSTPPSIHKVQSAGVPLETFKVTPRLLVAFVTLSVITLMVALDGTSLSVALPVSSVVCTACAVTTLTTVQIIAQKLKGTAIEAFWSGTSFLLTSTIFQPSFASFSHIFGRKPLVITGLVFFLLGAIVAALSNNFGMLLVGRSFQGIGGGGLIALTEILVTDLVPLRLRGQWFGIISGMWSIGSVTGPIIGGAFAQSVSWVSHAGWY